MHFDHAMNHKSSWLHKAEIYKSSYGIIAIIIMSSTWEGPYLVSLSLFVIYE